MRFFRDLRPESQILTHHPCPLLFEKFSLDALNNAQKPSVKKRSTEPIRNRSTSRSTSVDFEIYRLSRVEKILIGSISGSNLYLSKVQVARLDAASILCIAIFFSSRLPSVHLSSNKYVME